MTSATCLPPAALNLASKELVEFFKIRDQEKLYDKLADFFAPNLAKHLDHFLDTPDRILLAQFSSQLVMQFRTPGLLRISGLWHARKGGDVGFLLQHLDVIVQSLNCVDEVAPCHPVPARNGQNRGVDVPAALRQYCAMLGETKKQLSLTRAALSKGMRARSHFLSVVI